MRRISLSIAAMLACSAPAFADECRPEFVDTNATVNVTNVVIGVGEFSRENFNIRVRNAGSGPCDATIRFSRVGGTPSADAPPYTLRSGATTLDIAPDGAAPTVNSELLLPNAPAGPQGRAVPFQLTMPSEWGLKAGSFSDQIEMTLLDPTGAEVDTLLLSVNIIVPQSVALRVVGATGVDQIARISLGNLSSDAPTSSDPFGVRIWSTSGYRVSFSSENQGNLVHEGNIDRFAYRLYFDNQQVNLIGGDAFIFAEHTPSLGRVHPMRAQAGPVTARAGAYEDRVTVTVTAV